MRLVAILLAFSGIAFAESGSIEGKLSVVSLSVGSKARGPEEAVVYLEDAPGKIATHAAVEMNQIAKSFSPSVLVVPVGTRVFFPNRDVVAHNVFSVSPAKRFDLGIFKAGMTEAVTLDKAGIVSVYCNIHPQMLGYILVMSNPFYVRPARDGSFAIKDVPPGAYRLVAWFPFGQAWRQSITVVAGRSARISVIVQERADSARHTKKDGKPYLTY